MPETLLDIKNLKIEATVYPPGEDPHDITIVEGVSVGLEGGKVLGLIGESGAGKSTIGLSAMAYGRGGVRITGGEVTLNGRDILKLGPKGLRGLRGREVTYVAQSAAASFNPAKRLMEQVIETSVSHGVMTKAEAEARAARIGGAGAAGGGVAVEGFEHTFELVVGQPVGGSAALGPRVDAVDVLMAEPDAAVVVVVELLALDFPHGIGAGHRLTRGTERREEVRLVRLADHVFGERFPVVGDLHAGGGFLGGETRGRRDAGGGEEGERGEGKRETTAYREGAVRGHGV